MEKPKKKFCVTCVIEILYYRGLEPNLQYIQGINFSYKVFMSMMFSIIMQLYFYVYIL